MSAFFLLAILQRAETFVSWILLDEIVLLQVVWIGEMVRIIANDRLRNAGIRAQLF